MSTSYRISDVNGQDNGAQQPDRFSDTDTRMFEQQIEALLQELMARDGASASGDSGGNMMGRNGSIPGGGAQTQAEPVQDTVAGTGTSPSTSVRADTAEPSSASGAATSATTSAPGTGSPVTSAGSGPNTIQITNTTNEPMTLGKFQNGQSTTDPSASITLQPGQTGTLKYQNGEAGFVAKADSSGTFQANASRLEYEADADGKQKYPDISYIDGRNASISLSDHAGLNKGDSKSIAADAPAGTVTTDAAGNKTIAGYYDGSTATMQAGADYMQNQLGTDGAYLHPNDDQLASGQNPMSSTQSDTLYADFGNA